MSEFGPRYEVAAREAEIATGMAWLGIDLGTGRLEWWGALSARRLFDGHLVILSMPWGTYTGFGETSCVCPSCFFRVDGWHGGDNGHRRGCPWLISARHCGIAD